METRRAEDGALLGSGVRWALVPARGLLGLEPGLKGYGVSQCGDVGRPNGRGSLPSL